MTLLETGCSLRPPDTWEVPLVLHSPCRGAPYQPVTVGVPFPQGALTGSAGFRLRNAQGRQLPVQALPLAFWPDGSVKWLLVDFVLNDVERESTDWMLSPTREGARPVETSALRLEESPQGFIVDTGAATFHVGRSAFPLSRVLVDGSDLLAGTSAALLTDRKGHRSTPRIERLAVEARGPVRATVRCEGSFAGRSGLRFIARLCFFVDTGLVRLRWTLHNPRRARHRGGLWDLGDPGSVHFRDLSLVLALGGPGPSRVAYRAEPGHPVQILRQADLEIYQDSSGGENWQSRNHVNRQGRVPCSFQGYRVRTGTREASGLRASPIVSVALPKGTVAVAVPEFWQQFPKAVAVSGPQLRIGLFPEQFADRHELQGGEQKTHTVWLDFRAAGDGTSGPLDWVHEPACARATPAWYAASGAIPYLTPADAEADPRLEGLLTGAVSGPTSFFARREVIDEYGWRNFGEVYADHEAAYYKGPPPVISHYNNQYDVIYGSLVQYLRTGDARWFGLGDALARHVIDIDIYHTDEDKAAYNGGLFWHTDHYKDAATCTHRAYSRANRGKWGRAYGGGPSNEHNYTTGLLHYYYLTGDPQAYDAVLGLAHWVLARDDGARTVFSLLDDKPTGLASATAQPSYHGPGRGSGNSINALLDAWLLTGQTGYLESAERLIRRVIHPADEVPARDLLNVELRWSYTVFLTVLARYLALKAEAGARDAMYAYAQASLLHYAGWMLEHERPYFDRPEQLEYPTETWAAQDLRKANVLRLAAAHADEPLRSRLLERGHTFAERAWTDLLRFESRSVVRAVALVLTEGSKDCYLRSHPPAPMPRGLLPGDFGAPESFVGQKQRITTLGRSASGLARLLGRAANPWRWWRFLHRRRRSQGVG